MKLASILAAAMLALAAPAVSAHAEHGHPQYGGIYGEAGTFQAELLIKDKQVTIYISNHGEALATKGASGKLTILGTQGKQELELKPAADNQLIATLNAAPAKGSKAVASITLPGQKAANVRYVID